MLHVFWNTLDPVNLDAARASLGRVYAQSGRQSRTRRVRDTPPVRELHASIDRGVRARARGPGRGLGTSAPTDWFRSQGNGEWALETRLAEQPCRDTCQGYAKFGKEVRGKRIEDSRCESADSSGGIAIGAPGRNISLCCGCGNLDRLPLRRGSASFGQSLGLPNRDRESPCRMRGRSTWTWAMNPQACMGRRTCPWRKRANRHPCQRGDRQSWWILKVLELEQHVRGLRLELGHRDQVQGRSLHRGSRRELWAR